MRFDHVGVATRDAADLADLFDGLLDAPVAHEETFDGMSVVFLELDDGGYFELLEPTAGGAIAGYLDREGPGIHHVALATDDIAAALDRARDLGSTSSTRSRVPGRGATRSRSSTRARRAVCSWSSSNTEGGLHPETATDLTARRADRRPCSAISRPIETGMPTYPGDPDVTLAPDATHEEDGYATSELRTGTHAGTHVDAPRHTLPRGVDRRASGGRVRVRRAPRRSSAAGAARGNHGRRASRTERPRPRGRPPRLPNRLGGPLGTDRYRDHPYLTAGAARRCQKLGVGVGLDTFGPDPTPPGSAKTTGPSRETEPEGTPAHDALLSDSLPIVENLCGLDGLPAGFRLYAFPPASGADGSPVRAVAEWEG